MSNNTKKILFAEDNPCIRAVWWNGLQSSGFEPVHADKQQMRIDLSQLTILKHPQTDVECHMLANGSLLQTTIDRHAYVLCFMDHQLLDIPKMNCFPSNEAVFNLAQKKPRPHIVLIGLYPEQQMEEMDTLFNLHSIELTASHLQETGTLSQSDKTFHNNFSRISTVLMGAYDSANPPSTRIQTHTAQKTFG